MSTARDPLPKPTRPAWLECVPCDVRWTSHAAEPCWSCGGDGIQSARPFAPVCNTSWETETHPPHVAVERESVA